jgi:hypothetical protein
LPPFLGRQQPLRHHGLQVEGKIQQQLRPGGVREKVEDAVQRLVGIVGMQRGQAQVPGLGVGNRVLHGLAVADLADQDDVRGLAHRVAQGGIERRGVQPDFALVDQRPAMGMHIFDRVFDRQDMPAGMRAPMLDHGRQRGRLAGAGGPRDQHQPARQHHQVLQQRRQVERLERRDAVGQVPDRDGRLASLPVQVDAEAAGPRHRHAQVHLVRALELRQLRGVEQLASDVVDVGGEQRPGAVERARDAVQLEMRRRADAHQEIRGSRRGHPQ